MIAEIYTLLFFFGDLFLVLASFSSFQAFSPILPPLNPVPLSSSPNCSRILLIPPPPRTTSSCILSPAVLAGAAPTASTTITTRQGGHHRSLQAHSRPMVSLSLSLFSRPHLGSSIQMLRPSCSSVCVFLWRKWSIFSPLGRY